jgi:hypothetical protein
MAARCGIPPCVHGEDLAQGSDKAIVPGTRGVTELGRMFEDSTLVAALVGCLMRQATSRGVYSACGKERTGFSSSPAGPGVESPAGSSAN